MKRRDSAVPEDVAEVYVCIARAAEIELSRLSRGNKNVEIGWHYIESFKKMLATFCEQKQSTEVEKVLREIVVEFCFHRPCRRKNDFPGECFRENLTAVSKEFSVLFDKAYLADRLALRLYEFCHIFFKHFNEGYETKHLNVSRVALMEPEIVS